MGNAENLGSFVDGIDLAPFFAGDRETAAYFAGPAQRVSFPAGTTLVREFERADHVFLLLHGAIDCGVHADGSTQPVPVGHTDRRWTPIGSSALRPPGRYGMTVTTREPSSFIRWPTADLWRLLYSDPNRAARFIEAVVEGGIALLEAVRQEIRAFGNARSIEPALAVVEDGEGTGARAGAMYDGTQAEIAGVLAASRYFRDFTDEDRGFFAAASRFLLVRGGERILAQGGEPDGLYVLVRGRISLKFRPRDRADLVTRSISREGSVFNWCGVGRPLPSPYSVAATRDTVLLYIPRTAIVDQAARNPEFGFVYAQRVLWLLSQFILSARTRLVSEQAENEIFAVASLIDQKATEIPLRSELYKIPHLLGHPNTRQDAFNLLHGLVTGGTPLERSLAALQLDILTDLERETRFRDRLAFIYERVAGADPGATRAALLQESALGMQHAFEEVPYVVAGLDNLPPESGFVAIYNHLACNAQYQLPNNFEFTLDSHFVSSILLRQYGTPGLRIVKDSDSEEFWHRGYYGRILTLTVSGDQSRAERTRFYQTVENTLAADTPVVIAPEGTNNTGNSLTETSPGPFQPGAFVLATRMKDEPWIVPIALANFDKSVKDSVFAAVIKKPFRLSDHVADPADHGAITRFIEDYRRTYRSYVGEARALADAVRNGAALPPGALSNLDRLDRLDSEFAWDLHQLEHRLRTTVVPARPIVFYGSSSFRLWESLDEDLHLPNVLNLGFGGSTLEACAHFFERLVAPHRPSALFVYAGDNDIGNGASSDEVIEHCRALLYKVDHLLPDMPVYLLSIKPSPFRAGQMAEIVATNRGFAALANGRPNTHFVDIFPTMLLSDGSPDASLFTEDMLHMNAAGYARWAAVLRSNVEALEAVA